MNELEKKFNADLENYLIEEGFPNPRRTANWAFQWFSRQQQWIPVTDKERLPKHGTWVLTITDESWYRIMMYGSHGSYGFPSEVTYFSYLPEPPK